jgi:hypothetical protein
MVQLNKLTYANKTNPVPVVDRSTQATAEDFNEIKTIVNATVDGINQIKSDEAALVAGNQTVEFLAPYPLGVPFVIATLSCVNAQGYRVAATITNKTKDGFDVNVGEPCTLVYLSVPQR